MNDRTLELIANQLAQMILPAQGGQLDYSRLSAGWPLDDGAKQTASGRVLWFRSRLAGRSDGC